MNRREDRLTQRELRRARRDRRGRDHDERVEARRGVGESLRGRAAEERSRRGGGLSHGSGRIAAVERANAPRVARPPRSSCPPVIVSGGLARRWRFCATLARVTIKRRLPPLTALLTFEAVAR